MKYSLEDNSVWYITFCVGTENMIKTILKGTFKIDEEVVSS